MSVRPSTAPTPDESVVAIAIMQTKGTINHQEAVRIARAILKAQADARADGIIGRAS